jgi:hypothetical protein
MSMGIVLLVCCGCLWRFKLASCIVIDDCGVSARASLSCVRFCVRFEHRHGKPTQSNNVALFSWHVSWLLVDFVLKTLPSSVARKALETTDSEPVYHAPTRSP